MQKINLPQSAKPASPNPVTVVCTGKAGRLARIPVHSRVAIMCSLKEYHEVGGHYLYICNVEQVYENEAEEALFTWNGYFQVRPVK